MLEHITRLLKRNKNMQHVNLERTGLSERMILKVARAMKRAKSLVSIHFCSNPGATERCREAVASLIRCMPKQSSVTLRLSEIYESLTNQTSGQLLRR